MRLLGRRGCRWDDIIKMWDFYILAADTVKITVFCNLMPCSFFIKYERFGERCWSVYRTPWKLIMQVLPKREDICTRLHCITSQKIVTLNIKTNLKNKEDGRVWTGFICSRLGACEHSNKLSGFIKGLLASKGLCCIELVKSFIKSPAECCFRPNPSQHVIRDCPNVWLQGGDTTSPPQVISLI
jgi:hypothetical protein